MIEKKHVYGFLFCMALFLSLLEFPAMSKEEEELVITSISEVVQYHESVNPDEISRLPLSLMQAVDMSYFHLNKILGEEFVNEHLEILGIDKRPDSPSIWLVIYEFNSNRKNINLHVAIDKNTGKIDENLSKMIKEIQEILLNEGDAKKIAAENGLTDIYFCELDFDSTFLRIAWRIWGWGHENTDQCRLCRVDEEHVRKGFLIDAENGTVLRTMYNYDSKMKNTTETNDEGDEFSDFISIDEIKQQKEEPRVKSSYVDMIDLDSTWMIYINETQVIEVWSKNISSQTRVLYHKIFVEYPDGTSLLKEGGPLEVNPNGVLYTRWTVPNTGKGIGIFDFRCEVWEDINSSPDVKHDQRSDSYWVIFHRSPEVSANYYCDDTWHHPSNYRILEHALLAAGGTTSPRNAAIELMNYVHDLVEYDRVYGERSMDLDILLERRGDCNDFADLYIGLARSINIPSRCTRGTAYSYSGYQDNRCNLYCRAVIYKWGHSWAESYYDGSFHHVDPTGNIIENPRCYMNSDPDIHFIHASAYTACLDDYVDDCKRIYDSESCLNEWNDVTTSTEGGYDTYYVCPLDVDGDGICDNFDTDKDGDGIPNNNDSDPCSPRLYVYPTSHSFGTMEEGQTDNWIFSIEDRGGGTLSWDISESLSWITVNPISGDTTTETDIVIVTIDTTGLTYGHHDGYISVSSNGGGAQVYVEVTIGGDTTPPSDVTGLNASASTSCPNTITLTWNSATDDTGVVGYKIYRSTTSGGFYSLIGTSTITEYTDSATSTSSNITYYYVVKAYDAANNESTAYSNEAPATTLQDCGGGGSVVIHEIDDMNILNSSYNAIQSAATMDSSGFIWIVYKDDSANMLRFKKMTQDGTTILGGDFGITFSNPQYPRIIIDSSNNVHIVWQANPPGGDRHIYYAKLSTSGSFAVSPKTISQPDSIYPDIGIDEGGYIHVVWWCTKDNNIYYEWMSSSGNTLGDKIQVSTSGTGRWPSVSGSISGRANIIWDDNRDGNREIYFSRFHSGSRVLAETRLTFTPDHSVVPTIRTDPFNNNNFLVVWREGLYGFSLLYKKIDGAGSPIINDIYLMDVETTVPLSHFPAFSVDQNGDFHAVTVGFAGQPKIFYQRFKNDGTSLLEQPELICTPNPSYDEYVLSVITTPLGDKAFIFWENVGSNGKWQIFMERLGFQEESPQLYVYPTSHSFGTIDEDQTVTWTFSIENTGGGILSWNISENLSWITVNPSSGDATTEIDSVTVTVDTTGLNCGQHYDGYISVSSNGGNAQVYVEVTIVECPEPDFSLSAFPPSQSVCQGESTEFTVYITTENGFNSPVNLGVSGLPSGCSATFDPDSVIPPGVSTLTIATSPTTYPTVYVLEITGDGGGKTHSTFAVLQAITCEGEGDTHPSLIQDLNGTYWTAFESNRSGNWDIWVQSSNDGNTWSPPVQVTTSTNGDQAPSMIQASDGRLTIAFQSEDREIWGIYLTESADNGATWSSPEMIAGLLLTNDRCPSLIEASDGHLYVVYHTSGWMGEGIAMKTSKDGWLSRTMVSSALNVGDPALIQTSDNRLIAAYSEKSFDADIFFYVSEDMGSTWSQLSHISTSTSDQLPSLIQDHSGTFWVGYTSMDEDMQCLLYRTSDDAMIWNPPEEFKSRTANDTDPCLLENDSGIKLISWASDISGTFEIYFSSLITANIQFSNYSVDDDFSGNSHGNGDGIVNPGEFIELIVSLKNTGTETVHNVTATVSTTSPYVNPYGVYSFDSDLYFGDILGGETAGSYMNFMVSDAPDGTIITFDMTIKDHNGNTWYDSFSVMATGSDTLPPRAITMQTSSQIFNAGDTVDIVVFVEEGDDMSSGIVTARIESSSKAPLASIVLYDDGMHSDLNAGDRVFGGSWIVTMIETDYIVSILASDNSGNSAEWVNLAGFTTKTFTISNKILVVDDDNHNLSSYTATPYQAYYTAALGANGLTYDIWEYFFRGSPDSDILIQYDVVMWLTGDTYGESHFSQGYYAETLSSADQANLTVYLENGGNLFICGQDIGYELYGGDPNDKAFYNNYLHAHFVQDITSMYRLYGMTGDPISNGLYLNISGGDGADNQYFASEIDPINGAATIFIYDPTATPGQLGWQQATQKRKGSLEREQEIITLRQLPGGVISSGSGAISVDTGVYRVVYFAFGFEAIDNSADRNIVMRKVIQWLHGPAEGTLPQLFNTDSYLVVGDDAYCTDVLGTAKIAYGLALGGTLQNPEGRTHIILTNTEHDTGNLIIVGGPAINPVAVEFDSIFSVAYNYNPGISFEIFCEGESIYLDLTQYPQEDICIIYLGDENSRNAMLVWGYGWQGTYAGSAFMGDPANWQAYQDSNMLMLRWVDSNGDGLVQMSEITVETYKSPLNAKTVIRGVINWFKGAADWVLSLLFNTDSYLVVGDDAYCTDVLGTAKIAYGLALGGASENPEGRTHIILTNTEHDTGNLIIVGGPAINPVAVEFDSIFSVAYNYNPGISFEIFCEGESIYLDLTQYPQEDICIIYLGDENSRNAMLVWGYGWQGTYAGSAFMGDPANWQAYQDSNMLMLRWVDSNGDGLVQMSEITVETYKNQ